MTLTKAEQAERNAKRAAEGKPPLAESKPPPADEPPKVRKRPERTKSGRRAADLKLIEAGMTELLVDTPGMLGAMTSDPWLVDHTSLQGPAVVARIVAEAERSDRFREIALKAVTGQSMVMMVITLGAYLAPIGLHYGLIPGGEQFGIPTRRVMPGPRRPSPEGPEPGGRPEGPPPSSRSNGAGTEPHPHRAGEPDLPPAEAV